MACSQGKEAHPSVSFASRIGLSIFGSRRRGAASMSMQAGGGGAGGGSGESNFEAKTVVELKEMLKEQNLPASGKKEDLIARLSGTETLKKDAKAPPGKKKEAAKVGKSSPAKSTAKGFGKGGKVQAIGSGANKAAGAKKADVEDKKAAMNKKAEEDRAAAAKKKAEEEKAAAAAAAKKKAEEEKAAAAAAAKKAEEEKAAAAAAAAKKAEEEKAAAAAAAKKKAEEEKAASKEAEVLAAQLNVEDDADDEEEVFDTSGLSNAGSTVVRSDRVEDLNEEWKMDAVRDLVKDSSASQILSVGDLEEIEDLNIERLKVRSVTQHHSQP
jgi:hypothetical protein